MPEFAGDAPLYFDPYSAEDLSKKILSIIDQPEILSEMAQRSLDQSKRYNWEDTAKKTWNALAELAK